MVGRWHPLVTVGCARLGGGRQEEEPEPGFHGAIPPDVTKEELAEIEQGIREEPVVLAFSGGWGQKMGTPTGTPVNGTKDQNLRCPGGLIFDPYPGVDGRNPLRTRWKPWETVVRWHLQGSHPFRVCQVVQDFVHPQYVCYFPLLVLKGVNFSRLGMFSDVFFSPGEQANGST